MDLPFGSGSDSDPKPSLIGTKFQIHLVLYNFWHLSYGFSQGFGSIENESVKECLFSYLTLLLILLKNGSQTPDPTPRSRSTLFSKNNL